MTIILHFSASFFPKRQKSRDTSRGFFIFYSKLTKKTQDAETSGRTHSVRSSRVNQQPVSLEQIAPIDDSIPQNPEKSSGLEKIPEKGQFSLNTADDIAPVGNRGILGSDFRVQEDIAPLRYRNALRCTHPCGREAHGPSCPRCARGFRQR